MKWTTMAALALALALPGVAAQAQAGSWVCEGTGDRDDDELDALSPNIGMRRILQEYRNRWDAAHVRSQCEAFAAGEPHDIRCLNDRRDWDAIQAMVPDDLLGMSNGELRPHYLALQEEDDGYTAALAYCRDVGAIE
jgi:hypothetical protein